MTLRNLMTGDMDDVFLNTEELGESVTLTTVEGNGPSAALTVALADPQAPMVMMGDHLVEDHRLEVVASRTTYRARTLTLNGTARDASRGDTLTFTGEHAGDWVVEESRVDVGDAQHLTLRRADLNAAGGPGAMETS